MPPSPKKTERMSQGDQRSGKRKYIKSVVK